MNAQAGDPVVHLELHTGDLAGARTLYAELCGWRPQVVDSAGAPYLALEMGRRIGGGIVEGRTRHALWLPYVEVADVAEATERARRLGARVLLEPREGPAGTRAVVRTDHGADLAFWQPARRSDDSRRHER